MFLVTCMAQCIFSSTLLSSPYPEMCGELRYRCNIPNNQGMRNGVCAMIPFSNRHRRRHALRIVEHKCSEVLIIQMLCFSTLSRHLWPFRIKYLPWGASVLLQIAPRFRRPKRELRILRRFTQVLMQRTGFSCTDVRTA
jgi:hypothetical protein